MTIKVQTDIPLPKPRAPINRYPFTNLLVGHSFFIKQRNDENLSVLTTRVGSAAARWSKRHKGEKFTVRKADNGVLCWRFE